MPNTGDAMSDTDRLKDKLAKLGVAGRLTGGRRQVNAANETEFLRAVLTEFDETVLARNLTFRNEANASISFEVANRRLHRLTDMSHEFTESASALLNQQFSETGDGLIQHLTDLLRAFFAASQQIHIVASRPEGELDPGNIGCAAEVIAAASSLALYEGKPQVTDDRTENFIDHCSRFAIAWIWFDEHGIQLSSGDDPMIKRLTVLAQSSFSEFDKQLNASFDNTAHCTIVGANDNGTHSVLYVKSGGQGAFMIVPTNSTADVHKHWQQSLG
jgi:hypothetical protein